MNYICGKIRVQKNSERARTQVKVSHVLCIKLMNYFRGIPRGFLLQPVILKINSELNYL